MIDLRVTDTKSPTSAATESAASQPDDAGRGGGGAITASELIKTYHTGARDVPALRGLDLAIPDAGFFAIMGPSGSGKSTLLHLLAGLDRPDSGSIEVAGVRVDQLDERQLTEYRRRSIGIIFQRFNLLANLTALENVTLAPMLDGIPAATRRARGLELLSMFGLADRADHRPDAMSGGEQQRVAIARALYFEPRVLFADEPTGALDSRTSEQMWTSLSEIAQERKMTVVMVTHEPMAAAHCECVFLLRDGVIVESFDPEGMDAGELALRAQHTVG